MLSFLKSHNTSQTYSVMADQEPPSYDMLNNVHHVYSFQVDMPPDYDVDNLPSYEKVMNYSNFVQISKTDKTDHKNKKDLSFIHNFVKDIAENKTKYMIIDNTKYKPIDIINKIIKNNYDNIVLYHIVNKLVIKDNKKDNKYFSVNGNKFNNDNVMILGTVDTEIKFDNFTSNKYKSLSPYPYYHIHHKNGIYFASVITHKAAFILN
jgi:hypothetical protein